MSALQFEMPALAERETLAPLDFWSVHDPQPKGKKYADTFRCNVRARTAEEALRIARGNLYKIHKWATAHRIGLYGYAQSLKRAGATIIWEGKPL